MLSNGYETSSPDDSKRIPIMCNKPKMPAIQAPEVVTPPPPPAPPVTPQATAVLKTDKASRKRKRNPLTINRSGNTGLSTPAGGTGVNVPS